MRFTKNELLAILYIGNGIQEISKELKISNSQVYRIISKLKNAGIINDRMELDRKTHINLLYQLLLKSKNIAIPLSSTGMLIYSKLNTSKTVSQLQKETGLHKTTIFKKIRQGRKISLLAIKNKKYALNDKLWIELTQFFAEFRNYENVIDNRIPVSSIIYYKNTSEIIFSNKNEIEAEKTAFSVYNKYGIKIYNTTNYYCLPRRKITKEEVFIHSLMITEKDNDIRNKLFIALFYLKYRKELSRIRHPILNDIMEIMRGRKITGYPSLREIKDKAILYNIQVSI